MHSPARHSHIQKSIIEKEINQKRIRILRFLYTLLLFISALVSVIYIYYLLIYWNSFTPLNWLYFFVSLLTFFVILVTRNIILKYNLKLGFTVLVILTLVVSLILTLEQGTILPIPYILIIILILASSIVNSMRSAGLILFTVIILYLSISFLHENNLIEYFPTSTETTYTSTFIILLLLWVIFRIAKIGYGEIQDSYLEAIKNAQKLEDLNKILDQKVKDRTSKLTKSYEDQVKSMYNQAIIGGITKALMHDLAVPLSSIRGVVDIAKDQKTFDDELIKILEKSTEQIVRVVDDSRDLMRGREMETVFNPSILVNESVQILTNQFQKNRIHMQLELQENLNIRGIESIFERIVLNIVNNAVEELSSTDKSNKRIIIRCKQKKNKVDLTVEDNGNGIEEKYLKSIFKPAFSLKKQGINLGLGLSFVYKMITEKFKGSIKVESVKNVYTRFILSFPAAKPEENDRK